MNCLEFEELAKLMPGWTPDQSGDSLILTLNTVPWWLSITDGDEDEVEGPHPCWMVGIGQGEMWRVCGLDASPAELDTAARAIIHNLLCEALVALSGSSELQVLREQNNTLLSDNDLLQHKLDEADVRVVKLEGHRSALFRSLGRIMCALDSFKGARVRRVVATVEAVVRKERDILADALEEMSDADLQEVEGNQMTDDEETKKEN